MASALVVVAVAVRLEPLLQSAIWLTVSVRVTVLVAARKANPAIWKMAGV